jgi:hypothetical protein
MAAKPLAVFLLPFFAGYLVWRRQFKRAYFFALLPVALLAVILLLGLSYADSLVKESIYSLFLRYLAYTPSDKLIWIKGLWDWLFRLMEKPFFFPFNFLLLLGTTALLLRRNRAAYIPLLWFASMFLYVQFGPTSLKFHRFFVWADRYFTIFTIPMLLVLACYLAEGLDDKAARYVVLLSVAVTALVMGVGYYLFAGHTVTINEILGTARPYGEHTVNRFIWIVAAFAAALALLAGLFSPLALDSPRTWLRNGLFGSIILLLGLSTLHQIEFTILGYRFEGYAEENRVVYDYLQELPEKVVYTQTRHVGRGLDYRSGFKKNYPDGQIRPMWEHFNNIADAYVVVDGELKFSLPVDWQLLQRWEDVGRVVGFYYAPPQKSAEILELEKEIAADPTPEKYLRLIAAYTRSARPAEALDAYHRLLELEPEFAQEENLLSDGGFEEGVWSAHKATETSSFSIDTTTSHSGQNSALIEGFAKELDWYVRRVSLGLKHGMWYQAVPVEQGAVYYFGAWVKMQDVDDLQVELLRWASKDFEAGGGSGVNMSGTRDWTYVETVLVLPTWASSEIYLAPVVVYNQGQVWVDDVRLVKLTP